MPEDWIMNDLDFKQIKNTTLDENVLKEFIENEVYKHPNCGILLKHFSDIYVLIACIDSHKYLKHGEKNWKDVMNKEKYNILEQNNKLIIGYMLIEKKDKNIHYIDLIDTIIRKNNFGKLMIDKYEKNNNNEITLIPKNIIYSSTRYWVKILNLYILDLDNDKQFVTKDSIEEFIEENNLNKKELSWMYLYDLCE
jgi:hypothetical protein